MEAQSLLERINSPKDIKNFSIKQLYRLADEIREFMIKSVSKTGGHLASSLGTVELTLALHKMFSLPQDQIVWDVGHQAYTHKILTGRRQRFHTLRQQGGISGFPKSNESEYDAFVSGHASNSISAALGLSQAKMLQQDKGYVIAVIGDGALSGGLAYEGLNNAGRMKNNRLIVILNDNTMSISKNVGAMARYLAIIRSKPSYFHAKDAFEKFLQQVPVVGTKVKSVFTRSKTVLKEALYHSTLFEEMGFSYLGPIDGHDIATLCDVLERAKQLNRPAFIHVSTIKGKGYTFAEQDPSTFHGISKFNVEDGSCNVAGSCFSDILGQHLCNLAEKDEKICAITAAMKQGTGLLPFAECFKNRFFDVGIAEEHAVTFASGLAANGMLPVFAVYSTFLQRGYDQIIHDVAIENRHVVLAVDRAGLVGEDGETHQGVFDVAFLSSIPNVTIYSPSNYKETAAFLEKALYNTPGIAVLRYPRGSESPYAKQDTSDCSDYRFIKASRSSAGLPKILLVTYGRLFYSCMQVAQQLKGKYSVCVLKLNKIYPLPAEAVELAAKYKNIFFVEEGIEKGGIGEHFGISLLQQGYMGLYHHRGIKERFVPQASVPQALRHCLLDEESILQWVVQEKKKR